MDEQLSWLDLLHEEVDKQVIERDLDDLFEDVEDNED